MVGLLLEKDGKTASVQPVPGVGIVSRSDDAIMEGFIPLFDSNSLFLMDQGSVVSTMAIKVQEKIAKTGPMIVSYGTSEV